jgi:beta-lactamase regulating signal transducer with metallopeptidase domain/DUF4097 and DUF4098 domain-containing protein YvlB
MRDALTFIGDYLASASFPVLLIVKSTVLLAAGALISAIFSKGSASKRYTVWALTLAAVVALPFGMFGAPAWQVTVRNRAPIENAVRPIQSPASTQATTPVAAVRDASRNATTALERSLPPQLPVWAWMLGTTLILLRMAIGRLSIELITRRARRLDNDEWSSLLRRECGALAIDRNVRLVASDSITSPVAAGIFSPVILVPDNADEWSVEHRQVVLRHELAHIARGDAFICLVAGLASALYWFNPLVWIATRKLRSEQEKSCDDRVLALGISAPDYAAHLLEVARSAANPGMNGFVSMAMARPSQLEGRLLSVLHEQDRSSVTGMRRVLATVAAFVTMAILSALHPVVAEPAIVFRSQTTPVLVYAPEIISHTGTAATAIQRGDSTATVRVESGGTLYLDLKTGAGLTITGVDEDRVTLRIIASERDRRNTLVTLESENGGARIESRYRNMNGTQSSSLRFDLTVPRNFNVRVSSAGGGVNIQNVQGTFSGSTGGGDIDVRSARGTLRLSTGGGDINVLNSSLSGHVGTGGGAVLIQGVSGGLTGSSGSGNVMYGGISGSVSQTVSGGVGSSTAVTYSAASGDGSRIGSDGRTYVRKSGGDVSIATAPGGASVSTGGGSISIGRAGGDVDASTGGGDVEVGPLKGRADVGTGAGDVTVTIDDPAKPVRVSSGAGTVTLIVPRNLSADLDLETAFTKNNGKETRIRGDIDLNSTVTSEWDSSEGTPRRYVRVRQSVGGGGPRIQVRTVNGDIIIRRRQESRSRD